MQYLDKIKVNISTIVNIFPRSVKCDGLILKPHMFGNRLGDLSYDIENELKYEKTK